MIPTFIAYVVFCGLVAYEAARQGRFAIGILIFSFLLTPMVTLWYLLLTSGGDRGPMAIQQKVAKMTPDRRIESVREVTNRRS